MLLPVGRSVYGACGVLLPVDRSVYGACGMLLPGDCVLWRMLYGVTI